MKQMAVMRFISRMIAGIMIVVLLGNFIDEKLNTTPCIMILLLLYVIIGSLYQLVKDAGDDDAKR